MTNETNKTEVKSLIITKQLTKAIKKAHDSNLKAQQYINEIKIPEKLIYSLEKLQSALEDLLTPIALISEIEREALEYRKLSQLFNPSKPQSKKRTGRKKKKIDLDTVPENGQGNDEQQPGNTDTTQQTGSKP